MQRRRVNYGERSLRISEFAGDTSVQSKGGSHLSNRRGCAVNVMQRGAGCINGSGNAICVYHRRTSTHNRSACLRTRTTAIRPDCTNALANRTRSGGTYAPVETAAAF